MSLTTRAALPRGDDRGMKRNATRTHDRIRTTRKRISRSAPKREGRPAQPRRSYEERRTDKYQEWKHV